MPPKPPNKSTRRDKGKQVAEPSSEKKSSGLTNIRTWLQAAQQPLHISSNQPLNISSTPIKKEPLPSYVEEGILNDQGEALKWLVWSLRILQKCNKNK